MKAIIFISCVLGHLWDKWDIRQRKGVTGHKGAKRATSKRLTKDSKASAGNPPQTRLPPAT